MSRKCEITNRGPQSGNTRSKALNSSRRKWNVNLQPYIIETNGKKERVYMSTKAIRTYKNKGKI